MMLSSVRNDSERAVLIVGADGVIGGALKARLEQEGLPVIGTSRRREARNGLNLWLDLASGAACWECPWPVGAAIICAAVAKIDACERDPEATYRINVRANIELARSLASSGAFVVFLSTNQVFDGSLPWRLPTDSVSPLTEYGRQKAEAERHMLSLDAAAAVVRLTKVIHPGFPLLRSWIDALRDGDPVRPFSDMVMAPVPLALVVEVLTRVVIRGVRGIVQVSGERDVTYADVAGHIADRLGVSPGLVQPRSFADAGIPPGAAPRHTTLDTARLECELGLNPPDVWSAIDSSLTL